MSQNSQYQHSIEIVEKIGQILGYFPGYRTLHADGRFFQGYFTGNQAAKRYSRALFLQGEKIPVSVRFSKGGGDPYANFNATVGMAVRFYMPKGMVCNLVMLSQKLFIANTVEQFLALLEAGLPTEPGGPINKAGLQQFLLTNPNSALVFKMRAESLAPVSFAHTEFNSVHAFLFRNAADHITAGRLHWVPVAGIQGQSAEVLATMAKDVLFTELASRLNNETVTFDLVLELAGEGDPLNDATALWPENRDRVPIGRLTLTGTLDEEDLNDKVMNHDPSQLTDGIDPTDDPILQIRRGVYEVSAAQRSSAGRSACPFGH